MKKEDVAGLIVYMLIIAAAVVYSLTILNTHYSMSTYGTSVIAYIGYVLVSLLIGIVSSAILLEVGHVFGALIGRYQITSVCVLYFTFYKAEKSWKFKFKSFEGLTGETKIAPKSEASNPTAFLTFGTILLVLWAIGCFAVFYLKNSVTNKFDSDIAYLFLTIGVVDLICLVYNIIPVKLDSYNDGYALRMLSNKKHKNQYNELLKSSDETSVIQENGELKTHTEITNYTAELNMDKVLLLISKNEYKEAEEILDLTINNPKKVTSKILIKNEAMKIFVKACSLTLEEFKNFIEKNISLDDRKKFADDKTFESVRAYLLIEGLFDNSKNECLLVLNKVNSVYKATPQSRLSSEIEMFNYVISKIAEIHPKWEMDKYLITL